MRVGVRWAPPPSLPFLRPPRVGVSESPRPAGGLPGSPRARAGSPRPAARPSSAVFGRARRLAPVRGRVGPGASARSPSRRGAGREGRGGPRFGRSVPLGGPRVPPGSGCSRSSGGGRGGAAVKGGWSGVGRARACPPGAAPAPLRVRRSALPRGPSGGRGGRGGGGASSPRAWVGGGACRPSNPLLSRSPSLPRARRAGASRRGRARRVPRSRRSARSAPSSSLSTWLILPVAYACLKD